MRLSPEGVLTYVKYLVMRDRGWVLKKTREGNKVLYLLIFKTEIYRNHRSTLSRHPDREWVLKKTGIGRDIVDLPLYRYT